MRSVTLLSPAKLNLFLRVIKKRPDGYHTIVTLFERINLCDSIRLTPIPKNSVRIICEHPHVPRGRKNLACQAAELLRQQYHIKTGVEIHIQKNIPVAAGLAGGSSNAATALRGLNQMWGLNLPRRKLMAYGRQLGSDVPFFLQDCSWALGTGRGDLIRPLNVPSKLWHILVIPRVKMYSREVFTRFNLQLTKTRDDVNILILSLIHI